MVVQLSKSEELPFKFSKQLHFQKCLPSSPCMEGSWVSNWELGSSAQYSENCACLKIFTTMGAQHIQCFSFPARACFPNAMLHEQQDSETQISSCICSRCLHFLASRSNVSTFLLKLLPVMTCLLQKEFNFYYHSTDNEFLH